MSKMNELSMVLDEMIECGEGMIKAARTLKEIFSEEMRPEAPAIEPEAEAEVAAPTEVATPTKEPEKKYSFEDVRKAFSAKSHAGFTTDVRNLITKYGAERLSGVNESDYAALMKDLEEIGNA